MNPAPEYHAYFDENGDLTADSRANLPEEVIHRLTEPSFAAAVKRNYQIAQHKARATEAVRWAKDKLHARHEARRPSGISGKQRKRLRRLARTFQEKTQ